jgi:hypothetical protein
MREVWTLADRRLAAVEVKFSNKAIEGDGDPQSAIVFVKTSERHATLASANMRQSHVLQVVSQPPEATSSTDRIEAALDNVLGITSRERAFENKQLSRGKLAIDEQAELDQLQAEREAKREARLSRPAIPTKRSRTNSLMSATCLRHGVKTSINSVAYERVGVLSVVRLVLCQRYSTPGGLFFRA